MSKYKQIETQFKDRAVLEATLTALNIPFEYSVEGAALYGYRGDKREETANFIVRRHYIGTASNDLGFKWNPQSQCFEVLISEYDQEYGRAMKILAQLKQNYAAKYAIALARQKGLRVVEQKDADGVIRIKLAGRTR